MFLSVHNGNYGVVYDANGVDLGRVISCDTETGCYSLFKRDKNDNPIVNLRGETIVETHYAPAPLRYEPSVYVPPEDN